MTRPVSLLVMTRIPEAGRVKTRLIPALGADGAAAVHDALLRYTLGIARDSGLPTQVWFTGCDEFPVADLPEGAFATHRRQGTGDLGDRLTQAVAEACGDEASSAIVIGTDCPGLSCELLAEAARGVADHDVVMGPAEDGGYYLIGLRRPEARLFAGIDWGTERVLAQTLEKCRGLGLSVLQLPVRGDVDEPEDLLACRGAGLRIAGVWPDEPQTGLLSVVIPVKNEARQLPLTVPVLKEAGCDVIVADGGSEDGTPEVASALGCRVVATRSGRGRQLNAGGAIARGEWLLFLHADTRVPATFMQEIRETLAGGALLGAFRLRIDGPGWGLRGVAWGANVRSRWLQLPYGDQGLFLRTADFLRLGGFRHWPLMEDFEFCQRVRRHGRIALARSAAWTSPRRWTQLGVGKTTLINQLCIVRYLCGESPESLAAFYRRMKAAKLPGVTPGSQGCSSE